MRSLRPKAPAAGYWVRDGQLLKARWGMIVQVFAPPWWAVHRWVWWALNIALDWIWARLLRPVLSWVILVPVGRPGSLYRGREEVAIKKPPLQGCELVSARVQAIRKAERAKR